MHDFEARRWARSRQAGMGAYVVIDGIGVAIAGAVLGELLIYFMTRSPVDPVRLLVITSTGGTFGALFGWRRWDRNEARYADYIAGNAACIHCGGKALEHAEWCPVVTGMPDSESLWASVRRRLW